MAVVESSEVVASRRFCFNGSSVGGSRVGRSREVGGGIAERGFTVFPVPIIMKLVHCRQRGLLYLDNLKVLTPGMWHPEGTKDIAMGLCVFVSDFIAVFS